METERTTGVIFYANGYKTGLSAIQVCPVQPERGWMRNKSEFEVINPIYWYTTQQITAS